MSDSRSNRQSRNGIWRAEVTAALILCIIMQFFYLLKISWDVRNHQNSTPTEVVSSVEDMDGSDIPLNVFFFSMVADRFGIPVPPAEQMNASRAQQLVAFLPDIKAWLINGETRYESMLRENLMDDPRTLIRSRQIWGSTAILPTDPKALYDALDERIRSRCLNSSTAPSRGSGYAVPRPPTPDL